MAGRIRVGIGGWVYEPWRDNFYPAGLRQKDELAYVGQHLTATEINATYYSSQKPATFANWAKAVPDGFQFAVKASRYCTNRKQLAQAAESIAKFTGQGIVELGDRLGPILWQFMPTKRFDPDDFGAFLTLLPGSVDGVSLRHALEVRNPTFATEQFYDLARKHGAAIVYAVDDEEPTWPQIDEETSDFTYARLMSSREDEPTGMTGAELDAVAKQAKAWAKRGDVFAYFISGAKVRNPAAAQALIAKLK